MNSIKAAKLLGNEKQLFGAFVHPLLALSDLDNISRTNQQVLGERSDRIRDLNKELALLRQTNKTKQAIVMGAGWFHRNLFKKQLQNLCDEIEATEVKILSHEQNIKGFYDIVENCRECIVAINYLTEILTPLAAEHQNYGAVDIEMLSDGFYLLNSRQGGDVTPAQFALHYNSGYVNRLMSATGTIDEYHSTPTADIYINNMLGASDSTDDMRLALQCDTEEDQPIN